jgi:cyclophilin family peptidyl-prolyl cis-trans isomerase
VALDTKFLLKSEQTTCTLKERCLRLAKEIRQIQSAPSSGSQFYLVHGRTFNEAELANIAARADRANEQFNQNEKFEYSEETIKRYMEEGGAPFLDNQYTVFGQVISGLDIIDSIACRENRRRVIDQWRM